MLLALNWPAATVVAAAIAAVTGLLAVVLWQTFAVVIRDDREMAREEPCARERDVTTAKRASCLTARLRVAMLCTPTLTCAGVRNGARVGLRRSSLHAARVRSLFHVRSPAGGRWSSVTIGFYPAPRG